MRALETILTEKGYVDPAALDAIIEAYETKIGPHNGAPVVPGYSQRYLRGREPLALEAEVEPFVRSLRFTPFGQQ